MLNTPSKIIISMSLLGNWVLGSIFLDHIETAIEEVLKHNR